MPILDIAFAFFIFFSSENIHWNGTSPSHHQHHNCLWPLYVQHFIVSLAHARTTWNLTEYYTMLCRLRAIFGAGTAEIKSHTNVVVVREQNEIHGTWIALWIGYIDHKYFYPFTASNSNHNFCSVCCKRIFPLNWFNNSSTVKLSNMFYLAYLTACLGALYLLSCDLLRRYIQIQLTGF